MKCFIVAMMNEAEPIGSAMKIERKLIVCGKKVYLGKLFGESVGLVVCGVGKVNAAMGTQIAIDELGAETVINIGVAGGLNDGLKIGNIYGISDAVQYDFDLTSINGTPIGTLDECKENYLHLSTPSTFPLKKIATGDRFNDSREDYNLLTQSLKADIRDMECGAVAQVAMHAKVKFCAFKIISDLAGSGSTVEQYKNNLQICFKALKEELETILKSVK